MVNHFWKPKLSSHTRYLNKKYGGTWKYDGQGTWSCDDNKRSVTRCSSCLCDGPCAHPAIYYLYSDKPTEIVNWY